MLVTAKEMLAKARDGKYAVGHFNINNLEWTKANRFLYRKDSLCRHRYCN